MNIALFLIIQAINIELPLEPFFFFNLLEDISPFHAATDTPLWTSGNVCPRFQSQGGVILRFTPDATPVDCTEVRMTAEPFWCVNKHWWRFGAQTHNHLCGEYCAVCIPFSHSGSFRLHGNLFCNMQH